MYLAQKKAYTLCQSRPLQFLIGDLGDLYSTIQYIGQMVRSVAGVLKYTIL